MRGPPEKALEERVNVSGPTAVMKVDPEGNDVEPPSTLIGRPTWKAPLVVLTLVITLEPTVTSPVPVVPSTSAPKPND